MQQQCWRVLRRAGCSPAVLTPACCRAFRSFVRQMLPHTHADCLSLTLRPSVFILQALWDASRWTAALNMYLPLVWVTGKRRNKGISKKAWHVVPALGHCHRRQFLPKALLCHVFPETTVRKCGLQGTKRKEPTVTTPFILHVLAFSHLAVLSQCMTFFPVLCIISSFHLHPRLCWNCPDSPPLHKETLGPPGSPHFFPSFHRALKSSLYEKREWAVRSGAPQQVGAVWNGF